MIGRERARRLGKRLLMALGVAAPFLAWRLTHTMPARCYASAMETGGEIARAQEPFAVPFNFCGLLHPYPDLLAAGGIVLLAFVLPLAWRALKRRRPPLAEIAVTDGGDRR